MSRTRIKVDGAWVDLPRGPKGATGDTGPTGPTGPSGAGGILTGYIDGVLVAGAGQRLLYNDTGGDVEIASVRVSVILAPTGGPAKFDVNLAGVTLFTDQSHRPTIAAGATTSGLVVPDITVWPAGVALSADVDLIGTTYAGAHATLQIGLV